MRDGPLKLPGSSKRVVSTLRCRLCFSVSEHAVPVQISAAATRWTSLHWLRQFEKAQTRTLFATRTQVRHPTKKRTASPNKGAFFKAACQSAGARAAVQMAVKALETLLAKRRAFAIKRLLSKKLPSWTLTDSIAPAGAMPDKAAVEMPPENWCSEMCTPSAEILLAEFRRQREGLAGKQTSEDAQQSTEDPAAEGAKQAGTRHIKSHLPFPNNANRCNSAGRCLLYVYPFADAAPRLVAGRQQPAEEDMAVASNEKALAGSENADPNVASDAAAAQFKSKIPSFKEKAQQEAEPRANDRRKRQKA